MGVDVLRTIFIFLVFCGGLAFLFRDALWDELSKHAGIPAEPEVVSPALKEVYGRLGIPPLAADLARKQNVARALKDLTISFCDKTAIYRLSKALVAAGERKPAATALLKFASACPNADGERYTAANILSGIGDYAAVPPIIDRLIEHNPANAQYYYARGQALSALGRREESIDAFTSALALIDDLKRVNSRVFTALADAYAATGKHCQAMTVIQTYVHADVHKRDTAQTRKLISDYGAKGNCAQSYANGSEIVPRTRPDLTLVTATINGVKGSFILDTGASLVALSPEFAKKANALPSKGERRLLVHTANGVAGAALTTLESVRVGRVRADTVSAAIMSKPIAPGIDGLLGMSFLARFDVTLESKVVRIKERVAAASTSAAN
jgi:aspartyl protease family protein